MTGGMAAAGELMPQQAELLVRSQQMGILSLALRALGDSNGEPVSEVPQQRQPVIAVGPRPERSNTVVVLRYGMRRGGEPGAGERSYA